VILRFATRSSALARWQTEWVMGAVQQAWPSLECIEAVIVTRGDREVSKALPKIGGKGLFTRELDLAILEGKVHSAVHSLKDLPIEAQRGEASRLVIAAIPERGEARDVLVSREGYTLETLPQGARLGTSSPRRTAQLLALRQDLRIETLRGNVDTRLRKAAGGQYDAIILAGAGVERLGRTAEVSQWLPLEVMLPAPGQGALAVQCRAADREVIEVLSAIDHLPTRRAVSAERAFLAGLGGGCALPVAAYAEVQEQKIHLRGLVASPDGKRLLRLEGEGDEVEQLGLELAREALQAGALSLLIPED
jgi:hydroxymethylbilane synthase